MDASSQTVLLGSGSIVAASIADAIRDLKG
jgi:hypothetical protein